MQTYYLCSRLPVLATVESNFNTYTGFQLKTNKKSLDTFTFDTLVFWLKLNVGLNFEYVVLCCHSLYSMVYHHVSVHSLSLIVTLFTIILLHNSFLSCIKAANGIMYIHQLPMFANNL